MKGEKWKKTKEKKKEDKIRIVPLLWENEQPSVISRSIALLNTNSSGFSGWKDGLFLPFYCSGRQKMDLQLFTTLLLLFFFFFSWESVKPLICHVEYIVYFNVSGSSFALWLKALTWILPMSLNLLQTFNTIFPTCQILNQNQILHYLDALSFFLP